MASLRELSFGFYISAIILVLSISSSYAQENDKLVIDTVIIHRSNVFDESTEDLKFYESWTNNLNIITKEKVIARELLFKEGDYLDAELIAETERRLRKFDFLGAATIKIDTINESTVNITVTTADQWTLIPAVIIESGGGLVGLGASLEEANLLGYGKDVYFEAYNESDVGTTWTFQYYDPRLFGTKWRSGLGFSNGPLIESYYFSAYKPFYSSDSKWSYGLYSEIENEKIRLFNDGVEESRIQSDYYGVYADGSYAFGKRYEKKRITLDYRYTNREYSSLGDLTTTPLPNDELLSVMSLGFSIEKHNFTKDTHIDHFKRTEDFTMGRETSVTIGYAGFPIPIGIRRFEYKIGHEQAFNFGKEQYLFTNISLRSQTEQNTIFSFNIRHYWQTAKWQTFAINIDFDHAWDLEESRQFLLGGDNGLRGYKARAFNGDKRMLMNIESRQFTNLSFLTVELGTVVFVDAGNAWERGKAIDLGDLHYSAGFGFRFGMTKSPGSLVAQVDLGWPIGEPGPMQITFGIGQHFSAD
jgi:outer membrane protein assembly factor BamA